MNKMPQIFFADRLPPLIGGVEMHAEAYIQHFSQHPLYPIAKIIKNPSEPVSLGETPSILFFNSGRWIEQMPSIRKRYPSSSIIYRTGGNEILKAPLDCFSDSHRKRQAIWVEILNETVDLMITNSRFTENRLKNLGLKTPFIRCVGGVGTIVTSSFEENTSTSTRFFCAARFVPYKNHDMLVKVFNEFHRRKKEFSLFLAGDGPLLQQTQAAAKKNPKIVFLGPQKNSDTLKQMSLANVYIQLSSDYKTDVPGGSYIHTEGMGRSILEAISAGTYVVAGQCGALKEIITPERGELVPLDSYESIIQSLERILETPPPKGPSTEEFNWANIFNQYENAYENLNHHRKVPS